MDGDLFDEDQELFRASVRESVDKHVVPKLQQWDADRLIDRETWRAAGKHGLLGLAAPKEFGGPEEQDYRYRVVIQPVMNAPGAIALTLMPYRTHSTARTSVIRLTAALVTEYSAAPSP
jgi:acyl-CoA dehydrogenase